MDVIRIGYSEMYKMYINFYILKFFFSEFFLVMWGWGLFIVYYEVDDLYKFN